MVALTKIYTRTGDDGTTGLVGGSRIKKNATRVSAYGDIDELNSHLGLCATLCTESIFNTLRDKLSIIQNELFDVGSELASPAGATNPSIPTTTLQQVDRLERWIDELNVSLPTLQSFVLPGGTLLNAHLHISRAVCRRAERVVLELHDSEPVNEHTRHYLNRLSDLLFVMSRSAAALTRSKEFLWVPGASRPANP
jgi:cob(I)alamin adenosyltransferase